MSSGVVLGWSWRIASCVLVAVIAIAPSEDRWPVATLCWSGEPLVEDFGESDGAEGAAWLVPSGASGSIGFAGPSMIGRTPTGLARPVGTENINHRRHVSRGPPDGRWSKLRLPGSMLFSDSRLGGPAIAVPALQQPLPHLAWSNASMMGEMRHIASREKRRESSETNSGKTGRPTEAQKQEQAVACSGRWAVT